jgi:hypothetical protein
MPTKPADTQVKTGNVNPVGYALGLPRLGLTVVLALAVALGSCTGANPVYPVIPKINITSIAREFPRPGYGSQDVQRAFSSAEGESLILTLDFQDGDGDIGGATSSNPDFEDFIVEDFRENLPNVYPYQVPGNSTIITAFSNSAKLPSLGSDTRSPSIEGTIRFRINALEALPLDTCVVAPSTVQRTRFIVYLMDRAGHKSNRDTTDFVRIRCQ